MNILAQVQLYIQDQKNRLNGKHIPPYQEVLQQPNTTKRKFKRNTETMPFEVTCTAWKALCQEKENKEKKKWLYWKERTQEKEMK
jgi:hypothetical protein